MTQRSPVRTRKLRIIAQDPAVLFGGRILTTTVEVPAEDLQPGPWGCRVQVIDYDSSTKVLLKPVEHPPLEDGDYRDPFADATDATLLNNPQFHAQNVYAIVMLTLARFEKALGRRIAWGFGGHQIKVAPHAFADANAFYSKQDEGLFFGYFPGAAAEGEKKVVFSCLSHDVVAHETTHALLDGLRARYTDPSSPDQAGFHEGFADVVALLSVFAIREVVEALVDRAAGVRDGEGGGTRVPAKMVTVEAMRASTLMALAKEMGQEMAQVRGAALRQSAELKPSTKYLDDEQFFEPHRRGEIFVAAMMNAFIEVWSGRLQDLIQTSTKDLDRDRVVEEGAEVADYLLTMAIRAIDYCMPVHLEYRDYLSALLTADYEIRPDDSKYQFRKHLRASFKAYGILPTSSGESEPGLWLSPEDFAAKFPEYAPIGRITSSGTHFEGLTRDPEEVFRFIWQNRKELNMSEGAFTHVLSVRPCLRVGTDGFFLRETVAEYLQAVELEARELSSMKIDIPKGMPKDTRVTLYGGGTVIFDEFGGVKYHINNPLDHRMRQSRRLQYLWDYGFFNADAAGLRKFALMHRLRAGTNPGFVKEEWH